MSRPRPLLLRRLGRDERGTTLVEFAMSVALFLLIFFTLLEFGRMSYNYVAAEKALQIAARLAVVRPPVCPGVPATNVRPASPGVDPPRFGAKCNGAANTCFAPLPITCTGNGPAAGTPGFDTSDTIWLRIQDILPNGANKAHMRYTYTYRPELNFLGGPFVPLVTVELDDDLRFEFLGILGGLAQVAGASDTSGLNGPDGIETDGVAFGLSVSLPGEDLAQGTDG